LFNSIANNFVFLSDKAPSLKKFAGEHLEADEYHKAMQDPEAVIIDVRNKYESDIGNFQPPENGAKLIDPKMRNSIEFPKWLNSEETQKQLTGKKVLVSPPCNPYFHKFACSLLTSCLAKLDVLYGGYQV